MFGWRRRSEGFEWKEYVRTTVLVRRADRQRRIEDARLAAIERVKDVADAGVEAGRAGASAAKSGLARGLSLLWELIADIAIAIFNGMMRWGAFAWNVVRDAAGGLLAPLGAALHVPADAVRDKLKMMPDVAQKFPIQAHHLISAALLLLLIYVGGPMLRSADGISGSNAPLIDISTGSRGSSHQVTVSNEISGAAAPLTGDTMRVDGTLVRLAGVEAPAAVQPCYRADGRRWNCASSARAGLAKIIRGRKVTCVAAGQDIAGEALVTCTVDGSRDIAAELVQGGYVFVSASSGSGALSEEENAARAAKRGIWQGEVIRPQEWRDQAWEAAKRDAPDGCPIKGVVRASEKIYSLPWSAAYARARVRPERGDRWFCSEDDAKAAGFSPSDKS
jgi:endonuclease YncB( thermonuclease family)